MTKLKVLDLFCGPGGLATGFAELGLDILGVDNSALAGSTYELNGRGKFSLLDLSKHDVGGTFDVVIGGPPCKPWSNVNTVTRDRKHPDYLLVRRFFKEVETIHPTAFLFENVLPVKKSGTLRWWEAHLQKVGYSLSRNIVNYSHFGAATRRQRFILFGALHGKAESFAAALQGEIRRPRTVRDKIWALRDKQMGSVLDHEWPHLKTIEKYLKYYKTGKYGWYVLKWDEPAPSFGNITKTYILHPESFNGGNTRTISVREAALIMGFESGFRFPRGSGLTARYQMIADSVSPDFSRAAARAVMSVLDVDSYS